MGLLKMTESNSFHSDLIVYAKTDGTTLYEHRKSCLCVLEKIKSDFKPSVYEFLIQFGIDPEEFWDQITFTVSNHDFGKINTAFQDKIRFMMEHQNISKQRLPKDIPHNFISPIFFTNIKLFHLRDKDSFNYGAMAAMYHHGPLFGITLLDRKGVFDRQEIIRFTGFYKYYSDDPDHIGLLPEESMIGHMDKNLTSRQLKKFLEEFFLKPASTESTETIYARRWIFPLYKQFLHLSDWIGSGAKSSSLVANNLWSSTSIVLEGMKKNATRLRKKLMRIASSGIPSRAILHSPTGSGKTEAAIRWADKFHKSRFIFALPTRSLVDDIYIRFQGNEWFKGYFHANTGILHSTSEYIYSSLPGDDPESHDFDRYFHRPVMVTTIDQILISLFNSGRWDAVNFSLALGSLVIDEMHTYDKETMSLILELIIQSRLFNMPILLMSATLPRWLPRAIKEITGEEFPVINVSDVNEKRLPWSFHLKDKIDIQNILESAHNSDVLVICNNVKSSVETFKKLHENFHNTRLINSRFIQADRSDIISWAKHKGNGFRILVSTQVIEVGIDIDFDILYSELAPVDTLIQRAGRVNRGRDPGKASHVFVYIPEKFEREVDDLIYGKQHMDRTLKEISKGISNNRRIIEAIDAVYPENEEIAALRDTFEKMHSKVILTEKYEQSDGIHSIPIKDADVKIGTRDWKYVSIMAVPQEFVGKITSGNWKEYAISVPLRSFSRYIDRSGRFPVIRLKYSHETGLEIPAEGNERDAFFI